MSISSDSASSSSKKFCVASPPPASDSLSVASPSTTASSMATFCVLPSSCCAATWWLSPCIASSSVSSSSSTTSGLLGTSNACVAPGSYASSSSSPLFSDSLCSGVSGFSILDSASMFSLESERGCPEAPGASNSNLKTISPTCTTCWSNNLLGAADTRYLSPGPNFKKLPLLELRSSRVRVHEPSTGSNVRHSLQWLRETVEWTKVMSASSLRPMIFVPFLKPNSCPI